MFNIFPNSINHSIMIIIEGNKSSMVHSQLLLNPSIYPIYTSILIGNSLLRGNIKYK